MRTPSYHDIREYDKVHDTNWIGAIREVCQKHEAPGRTSSCFDQFKTDWISAGLRYAVIQTLRYVGFGYTSAMVFKDVGEVIGRLFESLGGY